jgi:membrane-associated phospholipid phosphatase
MAPSPGPSLPIAIWVSRLFHPFVVPLPVLVVALVLSGCSWRAALGWTLLCVGVVIVPSVLLLVLERRRRGDGDWFVTVREQRRSLYALGGLCLLVLLGILLLAGAPRLLLASLAAGVVANAIGALLNRVTKVSVHAGAIAGSAVLLAYALPAAGALLGLAALLVAWARVRLEHHTPSQVLLGAGITASCVALGLHLLA